MMYTGRIPLQYIQITNTGNNAGNVPASYACVVNYIARWSSSAHIVRAMCVMILYVYMYTYIIYYTCVNQFALVYSFYVLFLYVSNPFAGVCTFRELLIIAICRINNRRVRPPRDMSYTTYSRSYRYIWRYISVNAANHLSGFYAQSACDRSCYTFMNYEKKFKLSYRYGKTVHSKILYKSYIPTFIVFEFR